VVDTASTVVRKPPTAFAVSRFAREIVAMVGLFALYKYGRSLMSVDVSVAYSNAHNIWELERWFHLPNELSAQHAVLTAQWIVEFANTYYALVHFPATIACFIWMYLRRPALYPSMRRAMIGITSIALLCHLVYPLAPPRMLGNLGFIDTAAMYGPNVYTKSPNSDGLVNQYAAMPSLHVGWAVLVAAGLIASTHSKWRWLWLLHPTLTTLAVVATANHYWVDSIAACIVLATVTLVLGRFPWARVKRMMHLGGSAPVHEVHYAATSVVEPAPAESAVPAAVEARPGVQPIWQAVRSSVGTPEVPEAPPAVSQRRA
jgi:hypothetical protein